MSASGLFSFSKAYFYLLKPEAYNKLLFKAIVKLIFEITIDFRMTQIPKILVD